MPFMERQVGEVDPGGEPRRSRWRILFSRTRYPGSWAIHDATICVVFLMVGFEKPDAWVPAGLAAGFCAIQAALEARRAVLLRRERRAALSPGGAGANAEPYSELQAAMRQLREREEHLVRGGTPH
jgi:hypothetical protein